MNSIHRPDLESKSGPLIAVSAVFSCAVSRPVRLARAPFLYVASSLMAAALIPERLRPQMAFGEIVAFAYDTFCTNKVRFMLTALGMVIGTASLILVVTIGMTGRQYVLNQIQAIGTNEVWAEYLGGAPHISNSNPDPLTIEDLSRRSQEVVPVIAASSPVTQLSDRVPLGNGKEKDGRHPRRESRICSRSQPADSPREDFSIRRIRKLTIR